MEDHTIKITYKKQEHQFTISDHPHHAGERCKYKVFKNSKLVATFEPDAQYILHLCQNPGKLDGPLVHELATKIEAELPHPGAKYIAGGLQP